MVGVKIFVFDRDRCLGHVFGEVTDFDGGTVLAVINFIEELTIAVEDLGGDGVGAEVVKTGGGGKVAEDKPVREKTEGQND